MLTNKFPRTLIITLFASFLYFCGYSQSGSTEKAENALVVRDTKGDSSAITEEKEDIIKKEKSTSDIKNSLTKREINIKKDKTSYRFSYSGRIQTRYDVVKSMEDGSNAEDKLYFRRVRFKSDGHLFTPKLGYKLEIDIIGPQVLDAYLSWKIYKNFEIWGGQTKLRGNRERVISSQNLQFVDRSLLNRQFTLDRDLGFWLFNHFQVGQGVLRQGVSVSKGEGLSIGQENPQPIDRGIDYTARLEYLPFGNFKNKGDYVGSDIDREPKPKLALGLTFDFNQNSVKARGQKGSVTDNEANLRSWIADLMFKYRGFSVMSEFVDRKVYDYENLTTEQYNNYMNDFYTGQAFNVQSGYVFKKNFELAARYTEVRPQESFVYNDLTEYTFALSKFFVGHKIKAQTDFSIQQEAGKPVTHIYRLQFEMSL